MTTAVNIAPLALQQFSQNGVPLAGGKLFTYGAGGVTKQATYTDYTGSTPNTNPIILDANGQCSLWLVPTLGYKFTLSPSTDTDPPTNAFWTEDGINLNVVTSSTGSSLVGYTALGTGAVATTVAAKLQQMVSVLDFGADKTGATDSTTAFNNAVATGHTIFIPNGTYLLTNLTLPSNTKFVGESQQGTILQMSNSAYAVIYTADPGSSSSFTSNVQLSDLSLKGNIVANGFQQVLHLFVTQGVVDLLIERCSFIGMQGDGIYIGTGNERGQNPTQVRHNQRVRIRNCTFNGLINNNRNGVTVVDCDGCWIEDNYFTLLSQTGMPGPIDIEPDSSGAPNGSSAIVNNINVLYNKFYSNAGGGVINLNLHNIQSAMVVPVRRINIIGNYIDTATYTNSAMFNFSSTATITPTDTPHDILVRDNFGCNTNSPFVIQGIRGIRLENNWFGETRVGGNITDAANTKTCIDVEFYRNTFYKVAQDNTSGGTSIYCYGTLRLNITRNLFDTFGMASMASNYAIDFSGTGAQNTIVVEDNTFYQPSADSNAWDVRNDGSTLSVTTFRHAKNNLINVNGTPVVYNNALLPDDWQLFSFSNSWLSNGGSYQTAQFMKDANGRVWFRGGIASGTTAAGTTILTLPVGFRPLGYLDFVISQNDGSTASSAFVQLLPNGILQTTNVTTSVLVSLDGISFKADQ